MVENRFLAILRCQYIGPFSHFVYSAAILSATRCHFNIISFKYSSYECESELSERAMLGMVVPPPSYLEQLASKINFEYRVCSNDTQSLEGTVLMKLLTHDGEGSSFLRC